MRMKKPDMHVWRRAHKKTNEQIVSGYYKRKKAQRIVLIIFAVLLVLFAITCHFIYPVYRQVSENVYDVLSDMDGSMFLRAGNTVIYDKDGATIGCIGNEKYEYVDIADISDYIQKGYIAKEDRNFTSHHGVDYKATFRAGLALIKNKGEITQGGSTITQQVVKNNLLTQEKTYIRKITEICLAKKIEEDYTKAEIMEFYCNSNYYGNGCYGVEGASEYYYGKKASDVTLAEAAILVATSNSPNNYNPVTDYDLAMEKKKEVLDDMLECGYITQEEHDTAVAEQPEIVQKSENIENESYLITYAIHCAALDVMKNDEFTFQYTFESEAEYEKYCEHYNDSYNQALSEVRNGGYDIYTSFDQQAQEMLQKSVDNGLAGFTSKTEDGIYKLQGAAVCVDNDSGMVVAIVGGREEQGSFNRGYQAIRQPGSCIKPLLDYGPGLEEGVITAGKYMEDKKTSVNGYSPTNATNRYLGTVTVREALIRSLNTVALQVMDQTGIDNCMKYLDKMQFSSLTYSDMISAATSIGGFTNGVTVAEMAKGFATLANDGKYTENDCIVKLERYDGEVIYEATDDLKTVYNEDTAFILSDIMHGLFKEEYGTGYNKDTKSQFYAGKTGSTNNRKDAWFCGYSTHYTTAVWTGYDTPQDLGFYGSSYPMSIWLDYMNTLSTTKQLAAEEFQIPTTTKLTNSSGSLQNISYTSNLYASRPNGWDYVSTQSMEKLKEREMAAENEKIYKKAVSAVEEFENFQITSMDEAEHFKENYNTAYTAVENVADTSKRENLMRRVAYKYELLNSDVINVWNDVISAYKTKLQEEKDADNKLEAQKSLEKAQARLKKYKIELVEYYIDSLNERTIYTDTIEQLISNGKNALESCKNYTEYNELSDQLTNAIEYARALPKEDTAPLPTPTNPTPIEPEEHPEEHTEEHIEEESTVEVNP